MEGVVEEKGVEAKVDCSEMELSRAEQSVQLWFLPLESTPPMFLAKNITPNLWVNRTYVD